MKPDGRHNYTAEHHTVRLDIGYRVEFEIKDGVVHILDIGNHIGH